MAKGSIRLSEKHGVNPTLGRCFYCGGETNEIGLLGRLPGDAEAPRRAVLSMEPCGTCAEHMKAGVIEVRDGEEGENPYRTGAMSVMRDDAVRRLIQPPALADDVLRRRMCFVPAAVWTMLGLPRTKEEAEAVGSAWQEGGR